jgi:serine/threonine protein kinase
VVTKLSHENLVFVFDYGLVKGQGYLAMEFVEGKTLTDLWNRCAQRSVGFPLGISLFVVSELCAGLGYAHRDGRLRLVHRGRLTLQRDALLHRRGEADRLRPGQVEEQDRRPPPA